MQLGIRVRVKSFNRLVAAVFLYFTDTSSMKLSANLFILEKVKILISSNVCLHKLLVKVFMGDLK